MLAVAVLAVVNTLPPMPPGFVGSDVFPILATSNYSNMSEFIDVITTRLMPDFFPGVFYRPVSGAIWGAEYGAWGLNARPYLTVNVVIHMLNVLLLIPLALVLFGCRRPWIGPLAAAIFACLPFSVDNVPVISRLPDLLSGTLILAVCAIHFAPQSGRKAMWIAGLLALFAFGIKETTFVIPPLISLGHLAKGKGGVRGAIRKSWPFWLILFLYMILRFVVLGGMGGYPEEAGRRDPLLQIPAEFFSTLLLPFGFLETWKFAGARSFALRIGVSVLLLASYLLFARSSARRSAAGSEAGPFPMSALWFLAGWMGLLLLIIMSSGRFERRYAYLAALPGTLLIAALLLQGVRRNKGKLIACVAAFLVSWNLTFAPLFGGYDEWKDGGYLVNRFLERADGLVEEAHPNQKIFAFPDCPQKIVYHDHVPYISQAFLVGRRSLRAYFSLRFPGRELEIVVRPLVITEPPER